MTAQNYKTSYVRHDSAHCMVPGLFVPLGKGQREKEKLDVSYKYSGYNLRFVGFEPLGADDLRLLQTIIALAGISRLILAPEAETEIGRVLRNNLDLKDAAINQKSMGIKTSKYELLKESGWKLGKVQYEQLNRCLIRMSNVTLLITKDSKWWSSNLISHSYGEEKEDKKGKLCIALNPRIAELMLGSPESGFTYIDMSEAREKMNEPTRILHQYLSAWVGPGKKDKVGIDKLIWHVWVKLCLATTMRDRKVKIRKALKRINDFDSWTVTEFKKDFFEIKRSRFKPFSAASDS